MKLGDLIEQLQDVAEELGDDCDVRLAMQPGYPLEYSVGSVDVVDLDNKDGEQVSLPPMQGKGHVVVYLSEGRQIGYLPRVAADVIGWGR